MTNLKEIADFISNANENELATIQEYIRMQHSRKLSNNNQKASASLNVGDRVWFDAKTRGIIRGVVSKTNKVTVKVKAENGVMWNVSASLVKMAV